MTRVYDHGPIVAVDGVSLAVQAGELVAIVGPSGSGKSTLLNIMGLLDHPDHGSVELDGCVVSASPRRRLTQLRGRRIGFLFQDALVDGARTSKENVLLGLRFAGVPRRHRDTLALASLRAVGLEARTDAVAATLSGGERQRVALARAIAHGPAVLLCDEPTGNLDQATTETVFELLAHRAHSGSAVVIVTHDGRIADRCHRVAELRSGRLTWV